MRLLGYHDRKQRRQGFLAPRRRRVAEPVPRAVVPRLHDFPGLEAALVPHAEVPFFS